MDIHTANYKTISTQIKFLFVALHKEDRNNGNSSKEIVA